MQLLTHIDYSTSSPVGFVSKNRTGSTPFEMGFLAASVLRSFKFLPNLIKRQGYSPCFFPKWLQNFYFALVTSVKSSCKMQLNGICLSCIGCCSAEIIADRSVRNTPAHVDVSYDSLDPKQPILPAKDCAGLLRGIYS